MVVDEVDWLDGTACNDVELVASHDFTESLKDVHFQIRPIEFALQAPDHFWNKVLLI